MKKGFLWTLIPAALLLTACKSTKQTTTTASVETATKLEAVTLRDSSTNQESKTVMTADTSMTVTEDSGEIRIERDSIGRPVVVRWKRSGQTAKQSKSMDSELKISKALHVADSLRADLTQNTARTEEKKATQSNARGVNAVCWIVWGFMLLFIVYTLASEKLMPWLKRWLGRWKG